MAHDYIHNVLERPRPLSNLDVCLKQTDADWHRPLIVRVSQHGTRNKRTRSQASADQRNATSDIKKTNITDEIVVSKTGGRDGSDDNTVYVTRVDLITDIAVGRFLQDVEVNRHNGLWSTVET